MENKLNELGIDCPECKSFIHTPLDQVLFGGKFECKACSTKFMLNKTSSQHVLQQLRNMDFTF